MLLKWHSVSWWGSHMSTHVYSVSVLQLETAVTLKSRNRCCNNGQLQATSSNSFRAHISFLFQFLHKHEKINHHSCQKTDWHVARMQLELAEVELLFNYVMWRLVFESCGFQHDKYEGAVPTCLTVFSLCLIILHHWVSNWLRRLEGERHHFFQRAQKSDSVGTTGLILSTLFKKDIFFKM